MDISQDPPEKQIRSDLWKEMSINDLYKQRDLLVEKISVTNQLISIDPSPTAQRILLHLQFNMEILRNLINQKVGLSNQLF